MHSALALLFSRAAASRDDPGSRCWSNLEAKACSEDQGYQPLDHDRRAKMKQRFRRLCRPKFMPFPLLLMPTTLKFRKYAVHLYLWQLMPSSCLWCSLGRCSFQRSGSCALVPLASERACLRQPITPSNNLLVPALICKAGGRSYRRC